MNPAIKWFLRIQRTLNTILLSIIVIGLLSIAVYVGAKFFSDPVEYQSLSLNKDDYKTGDTFSYNFKTCRNSGAEVPGNISRAFVPVERINDKWTPVKGRAPIPLFQSSFVTNEKGCRETKIITIIPYMDTGDYQLRIIGTYTTLQILPPSVDTIMSQTVHITQSRLVTEQDQRNGSIANTDDNSTQTIITPGQVQSNPQPISKQVNPSTPSGSNGGSTGGNNGGGNNTDPEDNQTGVVPGLVNGLLNTATDELKDLSKTLLGD